MTLNGKLPAFCIPQPRGSTNRCFLHARLAILRPSTNFTDYPTNRDLDSRANYSTVKTAEVTSLAPFGGV